jgi:hypothetical protein
MRDPLGDDVTEYLSGSGFAGREDLDPFCHDEAGILSDNPVPARCPWFVRILHPSVRISHRPTARIGQAVVRAEAGLASRPGDRLGASACRSL